METLLSFRTCDTYDVNGNKVSINRNYFYTAVYFYTMLKLDVDPHNKIRRTTTLHDGLKLGTRISLFMSYLPIVN